MASKAAILRLVPSVRPKLSRVNALRLDQTLNLISDSGEAVLAKVLHDLYPGQKRDSALTMFRQFRQEITSAAQEAGVRLSLETDRQTRAAPADRVAWFEAEDRVEEAAKRMTAAEVAGVERSPQFAKEDRPLRFFVCYAREDAKPKADLLKRLLALMRAHRAAEFKLWSDIEILPGTQWRQEIHKEMKNCDFGLLLVSPHFQASEFITTVELPHLLGSKPVIPVGLQPVHELNELAEHQVFFDAGGKTFGERTSDNPRAAFALELFRKILARLTNQPETPRPKSDHQRMLRDVLGDFDEERFVHTQGVMTTMNKGLEAAPEIDPSQRKDAIDFLMEWLNDPKAQPYCALLGEYGMGKTTTCKFLAKHLLDLRDKGEAVPLPIYLDLRHVGEYARGEPVLDEILERILKRSWKGGPEGARLGPHELIGLVENGALVIWDGLDEVLVHLDANMGQSFTRQLFRILPHRLKTVTLGKMLISCRTHYFRTLRDQQTHFRAEDRDDIRKDDYRAPFVLLPFTTAQIREYLAHTLKDENPDRVMEVLKTVHNLEEMAERPYTLSLIAEQFAQIEQWKAEGRRVTGLMLYRHMALSWLERDQGKHQIEPDHKQALMEHFAAALWRSGAKSWSVGELEQWLIDFLKARPELAAHYEGKTSTVLKEDLRTATFLVREGEDKFRFAHTSLQEFFLAGYLRRALVEGRPELWTMPRANRETLDFLGQWLAEDREHNDAALATLGQLRDTYLDRASELAFAYFLLAHRKGYPAPSPAGFQLPGADLSDWEISGSADTPLMLAGMNLKGAQLWHTRWRHCNLESAGFDGANALGGEWLECHLAESSWCGASLEATVFRDCELRSASFETARCDHTQWLRCELDGTMGLPPGRPKALYTQSGNAPTKIAPDWLTAATGHTNGVRGCAWSPDGARLVSASDDNTLRIWDAKTGKSVLTLQGHTHGVLGCAWSPDGARLVSASDDNTLRIWDAKTGKSVLTLQGHTNGVLGCAWSPDGARLVSASSDNTLRIWDAKTGKSVLTLQGHADWVRGCAWSPDGARLVSASDDNTLRIWDAKTGKSVLTLQGHTNGVMGCAWSPDGARLVSASYDNTLRIWDAKTGKSVLTLQGHTNWVRGCAWSPDGARLVSASDDNTLRIWDAKTGKSVLTLQGHTNLVMGCAWSPDGARLVSASSDNTLRIWDAKTGKSVLTLQGHTNWVMGCAWSPDGARLVSASYDKTLRIWDAKTGKSVLTLQGHADWVRGCAWSPDGARLVSASDDNTLRIWDAKTGKSVLTLQGHTNGVMGCAWSPDGARLVSASYDNTLRIWDAKTGKSVLTLQGHTNWVRGCAWSPDGARLVSASDDNTLRIWDAKTGKSVLTLQGHTNLVMGCAWSPDGARLVSASSDNTLRIWDAKTGKSVLTLQGHTNWVMGCAWSPDGARLVSASYDKTLRIWDAKTGKSVLTLQGHTASVSSCAWSPDGKRIISASDDGTIRTWDAATGQEIAPAMYHFSHGWASLDHQNNRVLACSPDAWRYLGWIVPDAVTGMPEWLPAETFGELPVVESVIEG